jgi:PEP-CTERM motif
MNHLAKCFALVLLLAGSFTAAHATTLTGTLSLVSDPANASFGPSGITFSGTSSVVGQSGSFSGFTSATFSPIVYATIGSGELLFTLTSATETLTFTATSFAPPSPTNIVTFLGTVTESGTGGINGSSLASFQLTNETVPVLGSITAGSLAPTPEPSSLILLGTGLVGAAGMLMRKRRQVTQ